MDYEELIGKMLKKLTEPQLRRIWLILAVMVNER